MYKLRKKLVNEEILKKNEQREELELESESETQPVNSVFASFKKYNNMKSKQNNVQESKNYIKEKINVFKYCGKIEDYTIDNNYTFYELYSQIDTFLNLISRFKLCTSYISVVMLYK